MKSQVLNNEVSGRAVPTEAGSAPARVLPSGRSVVLKIGDGCENLEVRSPDGDVEVRITLTDQGAVVSLRGGRLQMESADAVALNCRRLEVVTTEGTALGSAGDVLITGRGIRVQTENDIRMNGGVIYLNCSASMRKRGQDSWS
jgi:hypothetical protein